MRGAAATKAAMTQSGLSLKINADMNSPAIIPTTAPSPEKPVLIPSGVIFNATKSEAVIVHTKARRHV